jgi:hypothetical protein
MAPAPLPTNRQCLKTAALPAFAQKQPLPSSQPAKSTKLALVEPEPWLIAAASASVDPDPSLRPVKFAQDTAASTPQSHRAPSELEHSKTDSPLTSNTPLEFKNPKLPT